MKLILVIIFTLLCACSGEEFVRTPQYLRKPSRIVGGYPADIAGLKILENLFVKLIL